MSGVSFHAPPRLADERGDLRGIERRVVSQVQRHEARVGLAAERAQAPQLRLERHELDEAPRLFGRRTEAVLHLGRDLRRRAPRPRRSRGACRATGARRRRSRSPRAAAPRRRRRARGRRRGRPPRRASRGPPRRACGRTCRSRRSRRCPTARRRAGRPRRAARDRARRSGSRCRAPCAARAPRCAPAPRRSSRSAGGTTR